MFRIFDIESTAHNINSLKFNIRNERCFWYLKNIVISLRHFNNKQLASFPTVNPKLNIVFTNSISQILSMTNSYRYLHKRA